MSDTKFTAAQAQQQVNLIKRSCYHAAGNFLSNTTPLNLHDDLAEYLNKIYLAHDNEIKAIKREQQHDY